MMNSLKELLASLDEAQRIKVSKAQFDIYNENLEPHVKGYLSRFYSKRTIEDVPLLTCVNLAKRIVDTEASIYRKAPRRSFNGLSEAQAEAMLKLYDELFVNDVMAEANRYYKLQGITHLFVKEDEQGLRVLPLKAHQLHVTIDPLDASVARSYVMRYGEGWIEYAPSYIRTYDKDGEVTQTLISAEEPFTLPIIPIKKPFSDSYWPQGGLSVTDFTIQFNALLSDVANIVRMQGFAQAYLKGPRNLLPENLKIGPNSILLLPVDPNNPVDTEFGFANPSPDLAGSLEFLRSTLSAFLTSRGLNPKAINTQGASSEYASGMDRLLAMIERFEATESDFSVFKKAEEILFNVLLEKASNLGIVTGAISSEARLVIEFQKPEAIMTDQDKLDLIMKEKEAGLITDTEAIMRYRGVGEQEARSILDEVLRGLPNAR